MFADYTHALGQLRSLWCRCGPSNEPARREESALQLCDMIRFQQGRVVPWPCVRM